MPDGFRIASAFVEVKPDLEGFREKLRSELEEATRGAAAKVKVGLDDTEFRAKVAELKARLGELDGKHARPKVGLNDDEFYAKLLAIRARLDELEGRRVRPKVGINDGSLRSQVKQDQNIIQSLVSFAASHPIILGVGGGLAALLPGIAGATAGLGLLAGVGGLAFTGIGKALSAHSQAVQQNAVNQAQYAAQIQSAQLNLAETTRNAAMSQAQAIESVTQAQHQEQTATASLGMAQYNLRDAWIQARYSLQQLNDELHNNKTNIEAAKLAVQQAEYQQKLTDQNAMSTSLDREQAAIAVKQAEEQLTAAKQRAVYVQQEANLQNKHGVAGSQQVVQAQQAVKQALFAIADARRQSALAQKNLTATELNNANSIKQAQLQVFLAQQQASQGMGQFAADMARLAGPARAIVNTLLRMHGAFRILEHIAQKAVAPGIMIFLRGIRSIMPEINTAVRQMGHAVSVAFAQFGRLMQTSAFKEGLAGLLRNGIRFTNIVLPAFARFLQMMGKVGGIAGLLAGIANGLTHLVRALAPSLKPISAVFTDIGKALADFVGPLGEVIGALADSLAPVLKALLPGWKTLLDALGRGLAIALRSLAPVLAPVATAISDMVIALSPLLPMAGQLIAVIAKSLAPELVALTPMFTQLTATLPPMLKAISPLIPSITKFVLAVAGFNPVGVQLIKLMTSAVDWFLRLEQGAATSLGRAASAIAGFFDNATSMFDTGVEWIHKAWGKLFSYFKTPVNFLIKTVYDHGIARLWNDIAKAIGMSGLSLPIIPALAGGGIVPGRDRGRDEQLTWLRPEEGVLVPGAARFLGHGTIHALNRMFGGGGVNEPGHYKHGGILGEIGHILGSIGHGIADGAHFVSSLFSNPLGMLTHLLGKLLHTTAKGDLGKMLLGLPKALIGDLAKAVTRSHQGSGGGGGVSAPGHPSGTVASWFAKAIKITGLPVSWIPGLETIGWYESGDNPNAINLWDSNAAAGDPSRGIMQEIMPTFLAYHMPGTSANIYDPVANIASAARYIKTDYGAPYQTPGLLSLARGGKYVGYDDGGWLMPGVPVNRTGRPEAVLDPEQSKAFLAVARIADSLGVGAGMAPQVNQYYYGTQQPTPEQKAIMMRDLALAVGGAG